MFYLKKWVLPEKTLKAPLEVPLAELGAWLGGGGRKEAGLSFGVLLAQLLGKGTPDTKSTGVRDLRNLRWPGGKGSSCPKVISPSRTWSSQMEDERCSSLLRPIWILTMALLSLSWLSRYLQKCAASKWSHTFHAEIDEESGRSPSAELLGLGLASACKYSQRSTIRLLMHLNSLQDWSCAYVLNKLETIPDVPALLKKKDSDEASIYNFNLYYRGLSIIW